METKLVQDPHYKLSHFTQNPIPGRVCPFCQLWALHNEGKVYNACEFFFIPIGEMVFWDPAFETGTKFNLDLGILSPATPL